MDLSIVCGLDYYTVTIYEMFLGVMLELGSVMSGGCYDNLFSMFIKDVVLVVGISLGVDWLLVGLIELGVLEQNAYFVDVYVMVFDESMIDYSQ